MIILNEPITLGDWRELKKLYKSAFPKEERKPFALIKRMKQRGYCDVLSFHEDGNFLGLAITVFYENDVLIDYFAVNEKKRGLGLGTKMLGILLNQYKTSRVFLEVERPYPKKQGFDTKLKRKSFYLKQGFCDTGVAIRLFGVEFDLLSFGGELTFEEYYSFYLNVVGKFAPEGLIERNVIKID